MPRRSVLLRYRVSGDLGCLEIARLPHHFVQLAAATALKQVAAAFHTSNGRHAFLAIDDLGRTSV